MQKNNVAWKGPCAVIVDADGQQILVKHGSFHVRKHSYNAHLGTESEASCSSKSSENVINVWIGMMLFYWKPMKVKSCINRKC